MKNESLYEETKNYLMSTFELPEPFQEWSWQKASKICEAEGGTLPLLLSKEQERDLIKLMKFNNKLYVKGIHIGLFKIPNVSQVKQ